jgi:hypothetical protein
MQLFVPDRSFFPREAEAGVIDRPEPSALHLLWRSIEGLRIALGLGRGHEGLYCRDGTGQALRQ